MLSTLTDPQYRAIRNCDFWDWLSVSNWARFRFARNAGPVFHRTKGNGDGRGRHFVSDIPFA